MNLPVIKVVTGKTKEVFEADLRASLNNSAFDALLIEIHHENMFDMSTIQLLNNTNKKIVAYSRMVGSMGTLGNYPYVSHFRASKLDYAGWLEVAKTAPQFQRDLFKNGFQLKYDTDDI